MTEKITTLHLPTPPRSLGEAGLALWRRVQNAYQITDVGGEELLLLACEAIDRAAMLRREIDRDGAVLHVGRGVVKDHPALKHELAAMAFAARTLQRLGLDVEPIRAVGRPGGSATGWRGQ
jgi:hypothetical protein